MLTSDGSKEGISDVYFVRFDFFPENKNSEIISHLSSQYANAGDEYEDNHVIGHNRTGEHFTSGEDISEIELPPFSAASTFLKREISVGTYHMKPLEEIYYLVTIAQLSENQIDVLQETSSPQTHLSDWKQELEDFIKHPGLIEIKQDEIPTHTVLGFSGHRPFDLMDEEELKNEVPRWITEYNRKTTPRFYKFGYDSGKPSSLLDQELIISAGKTPTESMFGVHLSPEGSAEHTEPALVAPFDHIVRPALIIFSGTWRINQIEEHRSKINELPEFDEESKDYTEDIQYLNKLEEEWEELYKTSSAELEEFDDLLEFAESDMTFVRFPEISIQTWKRRHISVDNVIDGYTIIDALYSFAAGTVDKLREDLEEGDTQQRRKSEVVDTRINRETYLQDDHWIDRPKVKVFLAVLTLVGTTVTLISWLSDDFSLFSSMYYLLNQIQIYLQSISPSIYIPGLILIAIIIFGSFRYNVFSFNRET